MKENRDIIEQFLDRELPPDARDEFERLLHNDADLGREVRAERTIRTALEQDALSVPRAASGPSQAILEKLAGTSAVAGATGGASGVFGALFTTPLGLTFLSIATVVGLVLGFFLFGQEHTETVRESVLAEPGVPSARRVSGDGQAVLPVDSLQRVDAGKNASSSSEPVPASGALPAAKTVATRNGHSANVDSSAKRNVEGRPSAENAEDLLHYLRSESRKEQEQPNVIRPDSLRLNLEMEKK